MIFLGTSKITSLVHPATYINKFLVAFSDGRLELWNFNSKKLIYKFKSHVKSLKHLQKKQHQSAKKLGGLSILEVSDSSDSEDERDPHTTNFITSIEQSPASDVVALGCSDGAILLLHLKLDQVLFSFQQTDGAVTSLSFRTDAASDRYPFLVSSSSQGRLHIWNLGGNDGQDTEAFNPTSQLQRKLLYSLDEAHRGAVSRVAFLPGEPVMVSSGADNTIKVWIFDSGNAPRLLRSREGHSSHPVKARFYGGNTKASMRNSSDAASFELVSAGSDGTIRIFNTVSDVQNREMSQAPILRKLGLKQRNQRLPDCKAFDVAETR